MPEQIQISRPDGNTFSAWSAEPPNPGHAPGVVVVQEWWGVNPQIKRVGQRLADAGYRVLIPDLYRGKLALDAAEAEHNMNHLDFADATHQDVRGAVEQLKKDGPRVGVMGFCMGGVVAMLAAMHVPEADAVVSWYGVPPESAGDPATIRIPVQCHFAEKDQFFPIASADALEKKLEAGHVPHECYRYDAAHAFGNEDWDYYNKQAASDAWQRSLAFLEKHLKG